MSWDWSKTEKIKISRPRAFNFLCITQLCYYFYIFDMIMLQIAQHNQFCTKSIYFSPHDPLHISVLNSWLSYFLSQKLGHGNSLKIVAEAGLMMKHTQWPTHVISEHIQQLTLRIDFNSNDLSVPSWSSLAMTITLFMCIVPKTSPIICNKIWIPVVNIRQSFCVQPLIKNGHSAPFYYIKRNR